MLTNQLSNAAKRMTRSVSPSVSNLQVQDIILFSVFTCRFLKDSGD